VINTERKIIFVHIPRTSGRATAKALGGHNYRGGFPQHALAAESARRLPDLWSRFHTFTIHRPDRERIIALHKFAGGRTLIETITEDWRAAPFETWLRVPPGAPEVDEIVPFADRDEFLLRHGAGPGIMVGQHEKRDVPAEWDEKCEAAYRKRRRLAGLDPLAVV